MEQALAALILFAVIWLAVLVRRETDARAQAAQVAQARREDRQAYEAQVFALERVRLLTGHPLGPLALVSGDAKLTITTPPVRELPAPVAAPGAPAAPPAQLPGVTTLGQVLAQGFRPTQDAILLALGPGGIPLTASVGDDLCHIVLCGATGAGKTNTLRLLLVQLLAAGCAVYLCNPKHTDRHWRTGEDWTGLAAATAPGRALIDLKEIAALLRRVRQEELPARQARFKLGHKPGVPLFLVIDEWPVIVGSDPALADVMADLVRLGREYLIEILTASQDVLVDTMGGTSGDRAQFQTRYYGGGDVTSKRVLMQPQPKGGLPEPPGRGVMYLWATPTGRQPQLVRVPLVDNADIARLLATQSATNSATAAATNGYGPGYTVATDNVIDLRPHVAKSSQSVATVADVAISEDAARALALFLAGKSMADIVFELRGIKSSEGGKYQGALTEITDLVRQAMKAKGA